MQELEERYLKGDWPPRFLPAPPSDPAAKLHGPLCDSFNTAPMEPPKKKGKYMCPPSTHTHTVHVQLLPKLSGVESHVMFVQL